MSMRLLLSALALFSVICPAGALEIDSGWQVVCAAGAKPTEKQAAKEIVKYIHAVTGFQLPAVPVPVRGKKMIVVKSGKYEPDEWNISQTEDGLLVSGGLPNGILYAAYEFIEQGLGCRFLAVDAEYIPKRPKIELAENFKLAGKPFFAVRTISHATECNNAFKYYDVKRKLNYLYISPSFGMRFWAVLNQDSHTYHLYAKSFPQDKDELFSLTAKGERLHPVNGWGPGQICLSNPEARDLTFKKMVELISGERAAWHEKFPGMPYSTVIDVSANDNDDKCVCPGCLALAEKYGGKYSGAMLDFTNDLAARLEKVYPEMLVQTFAYRYTQEAPEGIAPRKNVLMHIALLGGEFSSSGIHRDTVRPLSHPNNREALRILKSWSRFGTPLSIWDYGILYQQNFLFPYANISALAPNARWYAQCNVFHFGCENEVIYHKKYCCGNFSELGFYLRAKLMTNPFLDPRKVIAEFMKYYYGPAEEPMNGLLKLIEDGMNREPRNLGVASVTAAYLTKPFFEAAEKLFSEAERKAAGDETLLRRIGQERITFDTAMLNLNPRLKLNIDVEKTSARLLQNTGWVFKRYLREKDARQALREYAEMLEGAKKSLPLPPRFEGKNVFDFPWYKLDKYRAEYADDPEAAGGKAIKLTGKYNPFRRENIAAFNKKHAQEFHTRNLEFGIYDEARKRHIVKKIIPRTKTPADEKYHWYHLGRIALSRKNRLWVHWSWEISSYCADSLYDPAFPETAYDVWLSIKLTGPAYARGSKKENAVYMDRIIFVR